MNKWANVEKLNAVEALREGPNQLKHVVDTWTERTIEKKRKQIFILKRIWLQRHSTLAGKPGYVPSHHRVQL